MEGALYEECQGQDRSSHGALVSQDTSLLRTRRHLGLLSLAPARSFSPWVGAGRGLLLEVWGLGSQSLQ